MDSNYNLDSNSNHNSCPCKTINCDFQKIHECPKCLKIYNLLDCTKYHYHYGVSCATCKEIFTFHKIIEWSNEQFN